MAKNRNREKKPADPEVSEGELRQRRWANLRWWVITLSVVFVIRAFIVEPYSIPSGSMEPTVEIGDHLIVAKFSYGLRIPWTDEAQVTWRTPRRGDIVVVLNNQPECYDQALRVSDLPFVERASDPSCPDLLKRVVALPGDLLEVREGWLHLQGEKVPVAPSGRPCLIEDEYGHTTERCTTWVESLPDGSSHLIYRTSAPGFRVLDYPPTVIPAGHVFLMGDNRESSQDGRVWHAAKISRLKGRSAFIGWNFSFSMGRVTLFRWVSSLY